MTWPILVNMRNRRTRHTTCLSRSAVTCTSITPTACHRSSRARKAGTRAQGEMTFGCVGPGSITLVSGFRYFVLSAFRYFVFSVFTVSGIRSGEGIGSRPAVGCLTRLSVAAADAATLRRAGLFRLMPVFTGFGFSLFRFFGISVNRCPGIYRFRFLGMCRQFFSCRIFLSLSTSLRSLSIWRSF